MELIGFSCMLGIKGSTLHTRLRVSLSLRDGCMLRSEPLLNDLDKRLEEDINAAINH